MGNSTKNSPARLEGKLEFNIADAPMIYHALLIGRNTAMLNSHIDKDGENRMRELMDKLKPYVPKCSEAFNPEIWATMMREVQEADFILIHHHSPTWYSKRYALEQGIHVLVNDKRYHGGRAYRVDKERLYLSDVIDVIEHQSPLGCTIKVINEVTLDKDELMRVYNEERERAG